MSKEEDKKNVYNQLAWILNYQPKIEHQHIHFGNSEEKGGAVEDADYVDVVDDTSTQRATGKRGRPKKAGKAILKSFIYKAEDANRRLQYLYNCLKQFGWIAAGTQPKIFFRIFSGEDTSSRVIWTGKINTLAELFRELVLRKGYVALPEGESIWVMVNARFWEKEGNKEFGNDRLSSTRQPIGDIDNIKFLVDIMNPETDIDELVKKAKESQG